MNPVEARYAQPGPLERLREALQPPRFQLSDIGTKLQKELATAGFRNIVSQDATKQDPEALRQAAAKAGSPGFGLRTLIGPEFPAMIKNLVANLQTGACRVVQVTCEH